MFKVDVLAPNTPPDTKAKLLASLCYQPTLSDALGKYKKIPIKSGLFHPGHHTPLESSFHTFILDNLPVSMCTFGLHMTHPFYNTTQRSGRFCSDMFGRPDVIQNVHSFIDLFLDLRKKEIKRIISWVENGISLYNKHVSAATILAEDAIKKERPKASDAYIAANAPKFAQEQTRNFISTIFPTGLSYTIDTITLVSMFQAAWNSPLQSLLGAMLQQVAGDGSGLEFMQDDLYTEVDMEWSPELRILPHRSIISTHPDAQSIVYHKHPSHQIYGEGDIGPEDLHKPLDLLHFTPHFADSRLSTTIEGDIKASVATFGQDQRHRTMKRSNPVLLERFYLPPLLQKVSGAREDAEDHFNEFLDMAKGSIGVKNMIHFIPYGAVVQYGVQGDLAAFYHNMSRRKCWCAQEEISKIAEIFSRDISINNPELRFEPNCQVGDRKCVEGKRYCGRDTENPIKRNLI